MQRRTAAPNLPAKKLQFGPSPTQRGDAIDGDVIVVWKLDRLGRSLRDLVHVVNVLKQRGAGFRSLQETLDTTTPTGRLTFHIFAALAEFERDMIRERTTAGLDAARRRGAAIGRPRAHA